MKQNLFKVGLMAFVAATLIFAGAAPVMQMADTTPRPWNPTIAYTVADTTPRPWNPTIIATPEA